MADLPSVMRLAGTAEVVGADTIKNTAVETTAAFKLGILYFLAK